MKVCQSVVPGEKITPEGGASCHIKKDTFMKNEVVKKVERWGIGESSWG